MKLFNDIIDETKNLLPKDGVVNYYGKIIHGWGSFYYLILDVLYCNFWRKKQPENSSMKSKYACVASRDISL